MNSEDRQGSARVTSRSEGWKGEKESAHLYRVIAEAEPDAARRDLFLELAEAAERQATLWSLASRDGDKSTPTSFRPGLRTRLVAAMTRRLGPRAMRPVLSAMKVRGMSTYASRSNGHAMPTAAAQPEASHKRMGSGGNLRAAVFGVNDGLLSNASLMMGMAGASPDPQIVALTGIAGLLAGAFAMASGEYLSVRSQREMLEHQVGLERAELAEYPREEATELALIYEAKGIAREAARQLADTIIADPEKAMDTLAREELGLNPAELGSPWGAALSSFAAFAVGAVVPLLPFLLGAGKASLTAAMGLTALSLFGIGAALSLFTGRSALKGGLRMLLIGVVASGATYLIGQAIGVTAV